MDSDLSGRLGCPPFDQPGPDLLAKDVVRVRRGQRFSWGLVSTIPEVTQANELVSCHIKLCNQKGSPSAYRHDSNLNPETRRIKNCVEIYVVKEPFLMVRVGRCYRNWHFFLFWVDFSIHLRSLASSDFLVHYSNDSTDIKRPRRRKYAEKGRSCCCRSMDVVKIYILPCHASNLVSRDFSVISSQMGGLWG